MKVIGGKKYYTVEEAGVLAGVSVRTLRRWIAGGRLSDFLYPFRAGPNMVLYRLEAPDKDDVKNEYGEWMLPGGGIGNESIGVS